MEGMLTVSVFMILGAVRGDSELGLWKAARIGDLANVNSTLSTGVNPNWRNGDNHGETALHAAAAYNHPKVVSALLQAGADKDLRDDFGMTPIRVASTFGQTEAITVLIDHGADVDIPAYYG
ncbi:unnamed protein product, partial [Meganyctiphanes norvegica]